MKTRNEYISSKLKQTNYYALSKKEKGVVLTEIANTTELDKNYLSSKITSLQFESKVEKEISRIKNQRKPKYDKEVVLALQDIWNIYHKPCSEILHANLQSDTLNITLKDNKKQYTQRVIDLLKQISPKSIDNKLKEYKDKKRREAKYQNSKSDTLLKQTIKICLSNELDNTQPGSFSTDLVESCGSNASGLFIQTFSSTDVFSGWWFGHAVLRALETEIVKCLDLRNKLCPFRIFADHTDNGSPLLNRLTRAWYTKMNIQYTRSRPNQKNDNCFVEQKNYTHVRKYIGYLRFDTQEELEVLNELFQYLMDFRNFFLPTLKLTSKIRIGAKLHKQYKDIRTPFHRLIESDDVPPDVKNRLIWYRATLNPIKLSAKIQELQNTLYKVHSKKNGKITEIHASQKPVSLRFLTARQRSFRLHD